MIQTHDTSYRKAMTRARAVGSAILIGAALLLGACADDGTVGASGSADTGSSSADTGSSSADTGGSLAPDATADATLNDTGGMDTEGGDTAPGDDDPDTGVGGPDTSPEDTGVGGEEAGVDVGEPLPPGNGVILEVVPLDIWAQPLPESVLEVSYEGAPSAELTDRPLAQMRLTDQGRYDLLLSAPEHHPLELGMILTAGGDGATLEVDRSTLLGNEGVTVSRSQIDIDGKRESVVTVFLGLQHRWFSASGRPARRGNRVQLMMDGEEAWSTVYGRLIEATTSIHVAVWWWESNFELVRPLDSHIGLIESERWGNTILGVLETSPATSRVLVWQDNLLSWLTIDGEIEAYGESPDDGIEFMGMTNSTEGEFYWEVPEFLFADRVLAQHPAWFDGLPDPELPISSPVSPRNVDLSNWPLGISLDVQLASWHQKFLVIDGDEAFVGGMNLRRADWDTSEHLVFDYRRMLFDASMSERLAVLYREQEPDMGPRKDYMVHIQGPAVQDVQDVFHRRWQHQIDIHREHWENATAFDVRRDQEPIGDGLQVQVTATMPSPFDEYATLESQLNAIGNAERYILIEDQYWRAPLLTEAIVERMEEVDDLLLVVITKPIDEWLDPGCEWTYVTHQTVRARFADRYLLYQLRAFDYVETWGWDETEGLFVDIDTHSKLLMVDDVFMSVGSTNKNNRGLIYEGEINVAILDHDFVSGARARIVSNMLGYEVDAAADPGDWIAYLAEQSAANGAVYSLWDDEGFDVSLDGAPLPSKLTPHGFLYPLEMGRSDDCFIEGVGPDMM